MTETRLAGGRSPIYHLSQVDPVGAQQVRCEVRFEESDLLQDLLVLAATEFGDDVVVSIYGGRDSVCGTVRFTFGDRRERSRSLRLLRRWAEQDIAVSLLSHGDELSLFSERGLFDRAREDVA